MRTTIARLVITAAIALLLGPASAAPAQAAPRSSAHGAHAGRKKNGKPKRPVKHASTRGKNKGKDAPKPSASPIGEL